MTRTTARPGERGQSLSDSVESIELAIEIANPALVACEIMNELRSYVITPPVPPLPLCRFVSSPTKFSVTFCLVYDPYDCIHFLGLGLTNQ